VSAVEQADSPTPELVADQLAAAGVTMDYGAERRGAGSGSVYSAEAEDPRCLLPEELDLLLAGAPWRRIISLGDSTIEGLGDPAPGYQTHPFVERLLAALRRQQRNLRFHNVAERDLTAGEVRESQLEQTLAYGPQLVIFAAGGNDMFPTEWDPDGVERSLEAIIGPLRGSGAEVITPTYMNPVNAIPMFKGSPLEERLPELNRRIRNVARRHGAILVDHENSPTSFDVEIYSHDIKHVTMRGHAIVTADFARALFEHLNPAAATALRDLGGAPVSRAPGEATVPTNPLVYGGAMDPKRLQSIPIFAELPLATLEKIALYAGERGVPEGEALITQGDYSHEMSCIESGSADVLKDGQVISRLGPGAVVGEIGLLRKTARTASVVATSPVRVITVTTWDLNRMPGRVVDRLEALIEERLRNDAERVAERESAAPR
jgi:lysophospholipase L1-like esterase